MLRPELRISRTLFDSVYADLMRPHLFAHERVGFLFGKFIQGQTPLVLFNRYQSVSDERYQPSEDFGALIDQEAILDVMQGLRSLRGTPESVFHVHIHGHRGEPGLSGPDRKSLPALIPGFQRMNSDGVHGILILSQDHAHAWAWQPGESHPVVARSLAVIGAPLSISTSKRGIK